MLLAKPPGYQRVFREAATQAPITATAEPELGRFGDFVSRDPQTLRMCQDLRRLAPADINILITGETGTGKELLARQVHALSARAAQPYLAVNCGAISEHLMESTFFGYVKGAFTGADSRGRAGYFEAAGAGTLFLDEVGELPGAMQAALLRVLEDGSFQRVGSCQTQQARCRIIAATHRPLEEHIAQGRFRQDLYFRLKVVQRHIKPLRERPEDITLLAEQFTETMRRKHGLSQVQLNPQALLALKRYAWPGNARELRNAIEAAVLCADGVIDVDCLPPEVLQQQHQPITSPTTDGAATHHEGMDAVRDYERQVIIGMLRKYRQINLVAVALGIARSTLYRKFAELGIHQADFVHATGVDVAGGVQP